MTNLDILKIVIHCVAFWNIVALVKAEIWSKHIFTEPNLSKRVQQSLVIVIGDSASILNLSYHVADSGPRDTLGKVTEGRCRTDFPCQVTPMYASSSLSSMSSAHALIHSLLSN